MTQWNASALWAIPIAVTFGILPQDSAARSLVGHSSAGPRGASGSVVNPALAAGTPMNEAGLNLRPMATSEFRSRYPGFDPIVNKRSGPDLAATEVAVLFRLTPHLSLAGYVFPPLNVTTKRTGLPLVLLDQVQKVDVDAKANLAPSGRLALGVEASENFTWGIDVAYSAMSIQANVSPSSGGDTLLTLNDQRSVIDVRIGGHWEATRDLMIGVVSKVVSSVTAKSEIQSPLLDTLASGAGGGSEGGGTTVPFQTTQAGIALRAGSLLEIAADLIYIRANPGPPALSAAELTPKVKDVYDTVAVAGTIDLALNSSTDLILGAEYQPASVGAGARGPGSKSGYGLTETLAVAAGTAPLTPFWAAGAGARFELDPISKPRKGKGRRKRVREPREQNAETIYRWTVEAGGRYQYGSLGIDEKGEQPAAYTQTELSFPVAVTWRF